jgi:hypothetical protein
LLLKPTHRKSSKSIKLWWSATLLERGDVLGILFGNRDQTVKVVELLVDRMKETSTLSITRRQLRLFANDFNDGKLGVRYSYHNFYTKLVRKLLDLGFLEKGMIWSPERRTTSKVYQLKLQSITERPPPGGFIKQAWQVAKGWNDLIQGSS